MKFLCLSATCAAALLVPTAAWTMPATATVTATTSRQRSTTTALFSTDDITTTASGKYVLDGEEIRGPLQPLGNLILVKVKDTLTATEGGVLLPDQAKEKPTEGLVIAAGPGKIHPFTAARIVNPIKQGMSVLYGKFDGKSIEYNDDACQMIRDDDCLLYYEGVTMKLNNVFPVRDYVLVELDQEESLETTGGVVIAQQVMSNNIPCEGTVIKVGDGRLASNGKFTKPPVSKGDRVKFKDYAGNDVKIEGKAYSLVKMVNLLATYVGPASSE